MVAAIYDGRVTRVASNAALFAERVRHLQTRTWSRRARVT